MAGNDAKPAEAAARPSTGKAARIRLEKHMRETVNAAGSRASFFTADFPEIPDARPLIAPKRSDGGSTIYICESSAAAYDADESVWRQKTGKICSR
jgi:hypothetical protein